MCSTFLRDTTYKTFAGYEPLISRDYSQALGDVWLDGVRKAVDDERRNPDRLPDFRLLTLTNLRPARGQVRPELFEFPIEVPIR